MVRPSITIYVLCEYKIPVIAFKLPRFKHSERKRPEKTHGLSNIIVASEVVKILTRGGKVGMCAVSLVSFAFVISESRTALLYFPKNNCKCNISG